MADVGRIDFVLDTGPTRPPRRGALEVRGVTEFGDQASRGMVADSGDGCQAPTDFVLRFWPRRSVVALIRRRLGDDRRNRAAPNDGAKAHKRRMPSDTGAGSR